MYYNKERIFNSLKTSAIFNNLYYYFGSFFINIIKLFIKPKDNLILFVSFGGKYYNDSPKAIYEAMLRDTRFKNFDFVWAFKNPERFDLPGNAKTVKIDSINYFLISLKARVWVSNMPVERRLNYSGKHTYYFCTWHGTPIKKLGKEVSKVYGRSKYDIICAQGNFDVNVWKDAFRIKENNILCKGLPRNDVLVNVTHHEQIEMKKKLQLPLNKKIILYCPTFRGSEEGYLGELIDFDNWKRTLGKDYLVLFRAHSMVTKEIDLDSYFNFVYDMSNYDNINDLMIASDMLVSDYSSVFFDYSILNKPMYCYTYDYEKYVENRGVYFDIRDEISGGSITEGELLHLIKNKSYVELLEEAEIFRKKYVNWYGEATTYSLDNIYQELHE